MGFKSLLGISLLLLAAASGVQGQYSQAPVPPGNAPGQQGTPALPPPSGLPQGYGTAGQPPAEYQAEPAPGYSDMNSPDWPSYPYPPYHNPYYEGAAKDFLTGTLEWALSLPYNVFDRVSNFLDGHVFPRAPATHGSSGQTNPAEVSTPGPTALPPAAPLPTGGR